MQLELVLARNVVIVDFLLIPWPPKPREASEFYSSGHEFLLVVQSLRPTTKLLGKPRLLVTWLYHSEYVQKSLWIFEIIAN